MPEQQLNPSNLMLLNVYVLVFFFFKVPFSSSTLTSSSSSTHPRVLHVSYEPLLNRRSVDRRAVTVVDMAVVVIFCMHLPYKKMYYIPGCHLILIAAYAFWLGNTKSIGIDVGQMS